MVEDAGAAAVAIHGRTAAQSYSGWRIGSSSRRIAETLSIPVFGSGDCTDPEPSSAAGDPASKACWWAEASSAIPGFSLRPPIWRRDAPRDLTLADRGRFLLEYIELLRHERVHEPNGFRHTAPARGRTDADGHRAIGHDRWVVNKIRALGSWYTKGLDNGSHIRTAINTADSIQKLTEIIDTFFGASLTQFGHSDSESAAELGAIDIRPAPGRPTAGSTVPS